MSRINSVWFTCSTVGEKRSVKVRPVRAARSPANSVDTNTKSHGGSTLRLYFSRKLPTPPSKATSSSTACSNVTYANICHGASSQLTSRKSPVLRRSRVTSPQNSTTGRTVTSRCGKESDRCAVGACLMSDSHNSKELQHHQHDDQSSGSSIRSSSLRQLTRSVSPLRNVRDTVDTDSHLESSHRLCDKSRHSMSYQCQQVVSALMMGDSFNSCHSVSICSDM